MIPVLADGLCPHRSGEALPLTRVRLPEGGRRDDAFAARSGPANVTLSRPPLPLGAAAPPCLRGWVAAAALAFTAALVLGFPSRALAAVDSLAVTRVGSFAVSDYDPWVADVWGYVDGTGREFALLCGGNSLRVLDCTDPAAIVEASIVRAPVTAADLKDVKTWDRYAYACQELGEILIVDLGDPYAAVQVGSIPQADLCVPFPCQFPGNGGSHNLWIDERGYLFVAGVHFRATLIYDLVADPIDPPLAGSYDPGYIHDLHVRDGIGYVANPDVSANEWEIVDFTDVAHPVRIAGMTAPDVLYAHSGWPTEDGAYFLAADEGEGGHLRIFDVRDRTAPTLVAEYVAGSGASLHNVMVAGRYAYLAYYGEGLRVLDLADPASPLEVGFYRDDRYSDGACSVSVFHGLWGIYAFAPSGRLYVSEMCGGGLEVLDFALDDPPSAPPGGTAPRLAAAPNPGRGPIELRADLVAAGGASLTLHDVTGRRIRSLVTGQELAAGEASWVWNGTDDAGRSLPSGVYLARLVQGGREATTKVVLRGGAALP